MEIELSKDGQPIFLSEGAVTCSLDSPFDEADRWIERHRQKLESTSNLFVLGLGSGYHVLRLDAFKNIRNIWVIDDRKEAVNFFIKFHHFDQRYKFLTLDNQKMFRSDAVIKQNVNRPYQVISFFPATKHKREFYKWMEAVLIGRDPLAFEELLSLREDFKEKTKRGFRVIDGAFAEAKTSRLLSIKDIAPLLHQRSDLKESQESIFKILQELIK